MYTEMNISSQSQEH